MRTAIRVVSMAGSPRRQTFHRPPDSLGLGWAFLDASSGLADGLRFDERLSILCSKRVLERGEIGCFSSHVQAWRELLSDPGLDQMIVIEDDVFVDWTAIAEIARCDWAVMNVDYLKLFAKLPAKFRRLGGEPPLPYRHLVEFTTPPLGTQAYLVTRKAARVFEGRFRLVSRTIDVQMDRAWVNGVPVIGLLPFPAMELSIPSIIGDQRWQRAELTARERVRYFAGRAVEHARIAAYPWIRRRIQIARAPLTREGASQV